jgi:hypothetical protein
MDLALIGFWYRSRYPEGTVLKSGMMKLTHRPIAPELNLENSLKTSHIQLFNQKHEGEVAVI